MRTRRNRNSKIHSGGGGWFGLSAAAASAMFSAGINGLLKHGDKPINNDTKAMDLLTEYIREVRDDNISDDALTYYTKQYYIHAVYPHVHNKKCTSNESDINGIVNKALHESSTSNTAVKPVPLDVNASAI